MQNLLCHFFCPHDTQNGTIKRSAVVVVEVIERFCIFRFQAINELFFRYFNLWGNNLNPIGFQFKQKNSCQTKLNANKKV